MTLDPPTQMEANASPSDDENLCLSTIHSAKGLEWHTVFVLSAIDGYLPSFQSLGDMTQLEEERRLMYVALTRAEKNLFIMKPNLDLSRNNQYSYSGISFSQVSRFLNEGGLINKLADKEIIGNSKPAGSFSIPGEYNNEDNFFDSDNTVLEQSSASNRRSYYL